VLKATGQQGHWLTSVVLAALVDLVLVQLSFLILIAAEAQAFNALLGNLVYCIIRYLMVL
jgi:hypothetical protein